MMASPVDRKEFLDLVRKSEVAEERRLDAFLRQQGNLPREPARIAEKLIEAGVLTAFQAEAILQGRYKRFTIGKYRILDKLGSGGMAIVYLCEHILMHRRVAVKVLPAAKAADPISLERFYREARIAALLDHPNIVKAFDIGNDDSLHFLVMEYIDGRDLQDLVKKQGPRSVAHACHYVRQAALGLEHARQRGMVHRDIKPSNILVTKSGQVKILDMGLARIFRDDEAILTNKFDETVLGSVDYLSPEQAEDSHEVDIRTDIYSLGATFYFLLTGKTLFGEGTVAQKLMWHLHSQPKPITELRPDVPVALAAIALKMVAKSPNERYQIPAEIADVLTPFVPPDLLAQLSEKEPAAPSSLEVQPYSANQQDLEPATNSLSPPTPTPSAAEHSTEARTHIVLYAFLGTAVLLLLILLAMMIKSAFFPSAWESTPGEENLPAAVSPR